MIRALLYTFQKKSKPGHVWATNKMKFYENLLRLDGVIVFCHTLKGPIDMITATRAHNVDNCSINSTYMQTFYMKIQAHIVIKFSFTVYIEIISYKN